MLQFPKIVDLSLSQHYKRRECQQLCNSGIGRPSVHGQVLLKIPTNNHTGKMKEYPKMLAVA